MIIAKIVQNGDVLKIENTKSLFQYSANLKMQFIKDHEYDDYQVIGFYRNFANKECLLNINKDGTFILGKDIFIRKGIVEFSFSLIKNDEEVHLGIVKIEIKYTFGNSDAILPEEQDTWIQVVSRVVEDQVSDIWDKDYKPQLEQNLNIIEAKTEEIKTSAAEVKQDALESSVNAKSALDSANLSKNSADNATLAKEKALEHMSNAERFKNDASSYANQANTAKVEAQKSATDASNSASSALNNANKAQQHLNSIVEKTNAFNVDYANKVNNFNSNVENANNTLDAKIEKANTDIDKKVLDANTNLDKKIADANTSMDGKVTVATEQANIATSKATELKDAVDKVKYLEDVVDTKLTQPYVSSPLIENATISDSDEGQLRNLKIYGKCTQKVETDIVPTPDRPVPIVSKKIAVNGEVVELRSLKESSNLFDIKMYGFENGLLDDNGVLNSNFKSYASSGFIKVKPNTKYMSGTFNSGAIISSGIFFYNKNKEFISKTDSRPYVTPNECKYVRCGVTINGSTLISDLAIVNNGFVISEGVSSLSSYVTPTVKDYKVVHHNNKKSYIERNVGTITASNPTKYNAGFYFYNSSMRNTNNYKYALINCLRIGTVNQKNCAVVGMNSKYVYCFPDWCNQDMIIDDIKTNLAEKPIILYYPLETPVIEEIPYLESDQSEFGVSFQDSTSPSPTIKSEVETISTLNIKSCAKNMFNPLDLSGGEIIKFNGVDCYKYTDSNNSFVLDFSHNTKARQFTFTTRFFREDNSDNGTYMYFVYEGGGKQRLQLTPNTIYNFKSDPSKVLKQIEGNYNYAKRCYIDLTVTQLEYGDTATDYEPYKETAITHTLAKPLLSLADGSVADIITLENRLNLLSIYTFTGNETFSGSYGEQKGYYGRYFMISNARGNISQKVSCNVLPHVPSSWSLGQEGCCQNANQLHLKFSNLRLGIKDDTPVSEKMVAFRNYIKELYNNGTPIEFLYILENPTIEPLEPELIGKLKTLMSFYPITHVFSNVPLEFDYKLNMPAWHKVVSGQVENAKDVIYNMQVKQNNLEVMQLQSALETQYNLDLLKLGGNLC